MNDRVPGEPGRTIGISHESWMRAGLVLPLRHFELRPCSELAHHSVVDESGEFVGIEIVGHEIGELFMAYAHCHVVHLIPNVLRIDLSFAAATVFECLKAWTLLVSLLSRPFALLISAGSGRLTTRQSLPFLIPCLMLPMSCN